MLWNICFFLNVTPMRQLIWQQISYGNDGNVLYKHMTRFKVLFWLGIWLKNTALMNCIHSTKNKDWLERTRKQIKSCKHDCSWQPWSNYLSLSLSCLAVHFPPLSFECNKWIKLLQLARKFEDCLMKKNECFWIHTLSS